MATASGACWRAECVTRCTCELTAVRIVQQQLQYEARHEESERVVTERQRGREGTMTVYLSVGQCGNQIAGEFWRSACSEFSDAIATTAAGAGGATLAAPASAATVTAAASTLQLANAKRNPLFDDQGRPHAVLVDSEPKVVQTLVHGKHRIPGLGLDNCVFEQCGRYDAVHTALLCPAKLPTHVCLIATQRQPVALGLPRNWLQAARQSIGARAKAGTVTSAAPQCL